MDPLAKLFGSSLRVRLLKLFLFTEAAAFSLSDAVRRVGGSRASVRRELTSLTSMRVLRRRRSGKESSYTANSAFPHATPLKTFLGTTTRLRYPDILKSLKRVGPLRLVALSGLFTDVAEPQIDLIVVGDHLDERALSGAVRTIEAELGQELRYAAFPTSDFQYRLGTYDRLIRDVFDYPHRILIDKIGLS